MPRDMTEDEKSKLATALSQVSREELTKAEIDQQDALEGACYQLVCDLVYGGNHYLEWDISWIGDLAELVTEIVCKRLKLKTEEEFYPYVERKGVA